MYPITPRALSVPPAAVLADVFSPEELDKLESQAMEATSLGGTGGSDQQDKLRSSKIRWLDLDSPDHVWVYERLLKLVEQVNATHFRFELTGLCEEVQLARYEADTQGHYDWHQDYNAAVSRKLSVTVQLTDASRYDGGELQIFRVGNAGSAAPTTRGTCVVFPAYQLHRVTPVTRGVRHSLVAWVSGPAFR